MTRRFFQKALSASILGSFTIKYNNAMVESTKPLRLQEGSRIGLIAPGSPVPKERIEEAIKTSKSLGLIPVLGHYVYENMGYLAGTDTQRLADLHSMYEDDSVDGIWCIRGGYGCTRLLPSIDYDLIRKKPKPLMGYSDITALHLAINKETGIISYHSPVAASEPTNYTIQRFREVLFGQSAIQVKNSESDADVERYVIVPGSATGQLIGGNLSLLAALSGTKWLPSFKGKLVFMEDIGEKPYRIDRMLTQLFQASDLSEASGIILGQFNDCEAKPHERSLTLRETLINQLSHLNVPVYYGFSFGHIDDQCTIPIGIQGTFDTNTAVLTFNESTTK